jgi:hypothetical protein
MDYILNPWSWYISGPLIALNMKYFKFLLVGIFFSIFLVKSEVVSWYRIYEVFRFQSFHMYGVIGTAIACGILFLQISKNTHIKSIKGAGIFSMLKNKLPH